MRPQAPCFSVLSLMVKTYLLNIIWISRIAIYVCLVLPLCVSKEAPSFLCPPTREWWAAIRSPGNLVLLRLNKPSSLSCSSYVRSSSPWQSCGLPLDLFKYVNVFHTLESQKLDTAWYFTQIGAEYIIFGFECRLFPYCAAIILRNLFKILSNVFA